jgi:hypothetical protein
MSTAPIDPPLRAVFTPRDAADTAEALLAEKRRWSLFLIARDAIDRARQGVVTALNRLRDWKWAGWAVTAAQRTLGWTLGAARAAQGVLRTPGIRPALVWLALTKPGITVLRVVGSTTGRLTVRAARATLSVICRALRVFGKPGEKAATWLEHKGTTVQAWTSAQLEAVSGFAGELLNPSGLLVRGVGALARARAGRAVLNAVLPGRWRLLAPVVVTATTTPRWVRDEAWSLLTSAKPCTQQAPEPEDDPTPPASVVRMPSRVEVEEHPTPAVAVGMTVPELEEAPVPLFPSLARHPARKQQAKKRR